MHLIQISDTHLFKDAEGELLGCNTRVCYDAILHHIIKEKQAIDLVLLTGDLSHDGSPESYLYLAESLRDLKSPVCWIPGNHDLTPVAQDTLSTTYFLKETILTFKNWGFFLMNSQFKGEAAGYFTGEALAELEHFLEQTSQKHLLIALHHQPIAVGSRWLDGVGLRNQAEFQKIIQTSAKLRVVLFGHVHQDFDKTINHVRYVGVPSTCIQFKPNSAEFHLDNIAPGYRYIHLREDGTIETIVKRLEKFIPKLDYDSTGY